MNSSKLDRELLTAISEKLDIVVGILAAKECEGDENDKIKLLHGYGLSNAVISKVLGLSQNAVAIRMTRMRKKSK